MAEARIVAASARTALGRSLSASVAAVRAGLARFVGDRVLRDDEGGGVTTARAAWLPDDLPGGERLRRLCRPAAFQALAAARDDRRRVLAFVAVPAVARPGRPSDAEDRVAGAAREALDERARGGAVEIVAADHAGGLVALALAIEALREGRAERCLVGGVDSHLDDESFDALLEAGRIRSRRRRFGIVPGEGCGFLLLDPGDATRLDGLGEIVAVAHAEETGRVARATEAAEETSVPEPGENVVTGRALSRALRDVLAARGDRPQVEHLVGDLNGEPHRADELGMSMVRVRQHLGDTPRLVSPASSWGDVGAASGPLAVGCVVAAASRGWGAPTSLVFAASDAGTRAAALIATAAPASAPSRVARVDSSVAVSVRPPAVTRPPPPLPADADLDARAHAYAAVSLERGHLDRTLALLGLDLAGLVAARRALRARCREDGAFDREYRAALAAERAARAR